MTKATETKEPTYERAGSALILPSLSLKDMKEGQSIFFEPIAEFREVQDTDDQGNPKMENGEPVILHILPIIDLKTGQECEIVAGFIVHKSLLEAGDYVGKRFEAQRGPKKNRTVMWAVYPLK